jgi:hypothetical protein
MHKKCLQVKVNRPVDIYARQQAPSSFSLTLTRLAVGFGPLSSPTFLKDSPLGYTIHMNGSPAPIGLSDLEI